MPISNRSIYPVFVSQVKVPPGVENEFEYVVNATLSNFIKQLACLSLKANDIFHELTSSLTKFVYRTEALEIKIQNINYNIDNDDINLIKPLVNQQLTIYKSHITRDDELLVHTQMPDCINEMFNDAQSPPQLFKLDEFRKNEEESMRFYTDPDFFLREWLKNARNERKKKTDKKKRRKSSTPRNSRQPPVVPLKVLSTIVQEPMTVSPTIQYNYCDVAVSQDMPSFNIYDDTTDKQDRNVSEQSLESSMNLHSIPPPPPIFANFPTCLPPAAPPASNRPETTKPSLRNLLADIQKGSVLRPVSARHEVREKSRDFREFIKELRPAWENHSDESDD